MLVVQTVEAILTAIADECCTCNDIVYLAVIIKQCAVERQTIYFPSSFQNGYYDDIYFNRLKIRLYIDETSAYNVCRGLYPFSIQIRIENNV